MKNVLDSSKLTNIMKREITRRCSIFGTLNFHSYWKQSVLVYEILVWVGNIVISPYDSAANGIPNTWQTSILAVLYFHLAAVLRTASI